MTDAAGHIRGVQRVDYRSHPSLSFKGLPPSGEDEYGLVFVELADGTRVTWATTDLGYWQALIDSSWSVELGEPSGVPADTLARVFPLSRSGWEDDWTDRDRGWVPTTFP